MRPVLVTADTDVCADAPSGLIAYVWDLAVIGFERQAWIDCVLANQNGPDFKAYLARTLNKER